MAMPILYPSWDPYFAITGDEMEDHSHPTRDTDSFYLAWDALHDVAPTRAIANPNPTQDGVKSQPSADVGPNNLQTNENAKTSYNQAVKSCREEVEAIVEECQRQNRKYQDEAFDLEKYELYCLHSLGGDSSYPRPAVSKRIREIFDAPIFNTTYKADYMIQGETSNCWFMAALTAISVNPDLVERLCVEKNEQHGVYGFVFFRDGEWTHVVVDDRLFLRVGDGGQLCIAKEERDSNSNDLKLVKFKASGAYDSENLREALQKGGEALFFARSTKSETWIPLIEKAYAKAHGDYQAIGDGATRYVVLERRIAHC